MKRLAIAWAVLAAGTGCTKDRPQNANAADEPSEAAAAKPAEQQAGVGVVSAYELGHRARSVPVSSASRDAIAAFERGRELHENVRTAEAAEEFRRAIESDPSFALAHAYLGLVTMGSDRRDHFARARDLAAPLSKAEQLAIDAIEARGTGDMKRFEKIATRLGTLAPRDWRAQMWIADAANRQGNIEAAISGYQRAIAINPRVAEPYNALAYAFAYRADYDKALEAARSYARLKPNEPNPHDSLGEILMLAGKFEEAERSFARAVEVAPGFGVAWEGVAASRAYRDDWSAALEALQQAREAGADAKYGVDIGVSMAMAYVATGKRERALALLEELGAEAKESPYLRGRVALARGMVWAAAGKQARAKDAFAAAAAIESEVRPLALMWQALAEIELGKLAEAERVIDRLARETEEAKGMSVRSALGVARGALLLARGDAEGAIAAVEPVSAEFDYALLGRVTLAQALAKLGKVEEAKAQWAEIASWHKRDLLHAFLRGKLVAAG